MIGTIHKDKFRIQKRHIYYGYAFAPLFYGTWREDVTGTLIEGYFGLHPIFGTITVFTLVVINVAWILFSSAIGSLVFLLVVLPSIGLILVGQLQGLSDKKYMQAFLERTLKARRVDANNTKL